MIKYIVFDFDGTLADTFETTKEIIKSEFKDATDEDFESFKDEGIRRMMKKKNIHVWELPKMIARVTSKMKNKENVQLFPEVLKSLLILSKSYKLGIVSSNSKENIIQSLKKYNIQNLFDFVYSNSSIFGKHIVLKKMCSEYRINPSEVIYIGDEDRDIVAAKKVKIKIIAVTWGYNSEKKLREENPDIIINSPKEIIEKISGK
ncbi:MAG: HAD-IA family hydrolase [Bacteroidales bacterium]